MDLYVNDFRSNDFENVKKNKKRVLMYDVFSIFPLRFFV